MKESLSILVIIILLFLCGENLYSQNISQEKDLKSEISDLLLNAVDKGLITNVLKDSISIVILKDSLISSDKDLRAIKYFLENMIITSISHNNERETAFGDKLVVPGSSERGAMGRGAEDFYKNDRGMKYIGIGWYNEDVNRAAARSIMENISRNLSSQNSSQFSIFLNQLSKSNSLYVRVLGVILGSIGLTQLGNFKMAPVVGGAPMPQSEWIAPPTFNEKMERGGYKR